jgi:hypothetical protein
MLLRFYDILFAVRIWQLLNYFLCEKGLILDYSECFCFFFIIAISDLFGTVVRLGLQVGIGICLGLG